MFYSRIELTISACPEAQLLSPVRDVELVRLDVICGLVSRSTAYEDRGVVIEDEEDAEFGITAAEARHAELRRRCIELLPVMNWGRR